MVASQFLPHFSHEYWLSPSRISVWKYFRRPSSNEWILLAQLSLTLSEECNPDTSGHDRGRSNADTSYIMAEEH